MAIESSNFCFNDLDRQRRKEEVARQQATLEHLAAVVIDRNAERLAYIAKMNHIDLADDGMRREILIHTAAIRDDRMRDYEGDYGWELDQSSGL
ncbi:MAG: hypothetical protein QG623_570 [Patescibacteria group bacterium]|nr:hypothetical protein [Patescibacteria group bacterium]